MHAAQPRYDAETARHATNLELFVDLVFVFAVTQVAELLSKDVSWPAVGKVTLIGSLVWWLWSQYTWAGSALDLQAKPATRILVLCTIPVTLMMAVSIPDVYHGSSRWFGASYITVQFLVLAMQGWNALWRPATRIGFLRYASVAVIAPAVVLIGSLMTKHARLWVWLVAAVIDIVAALRASGGEWTINPTHFVERHALFVIISLGEALVAIGASATKAGLSLHIAVGLVVAASLACVMWWTYFAYIPDVGEHYLKACQGVDRGRSARDLFSFGHLPLVIGIIGYAVVVRRMVPVPGERLEPAVLRVLGGSIVLMSSTFVVLAWRIGRIIKPERTAAIIVTIGWCVIGRNLPGSVVIGVLGVVLGIVQGVSWRRFRQGDMASLTSNR